MSTAQAVTKTTPRRLSAFALIAALALAPVVASGEQAEASTACSTTLNANPGSWSANPRPIANKDELVWLSQNSAGNWDKNYIVTAQTIDLGGCAWTPIGLANAAEAFIGEFDGGGNTIAGLSTDGSLSGYHGMFGYVRNGLITRVSLIDVQISAINDPFSVGGLVAEADSTTISNSSVSGSISSTGDLVGGLVGYSYKFNGGPPVLDNVNSSVTVVGGEIVGGLVGLFEDGQIDASTSSGSVSGEERLGGLVGEVKNADIEDSSSAASVTGTVTTGTQYVGGLVGNFDGSGTIKDSSASGEVVGSGDRIGGLAGRVEKGGNVLRSFATGNVTGDGAEVGGLVGKQDTGEITASYATGSVTGNTEVGGLVGELENAEISSSYATGAVEALSVGTTRGDAGGLVGNMGGSSDSSSIVSNSYATGDVSGVLDVGGLVGRVRANSSVEDSYSRGVVTGNSQVGGLVGRVDGSNATVLTSYWDRESSGQTVSDGGTGKSTADMKSIETYTTAPADWSIVVGFEPFDPPTKVWGICPGEGYPYLLWQFDADPFDAGLCVLPVSAGSGASPESSKSSGPDASAAPGIHLDVQASVGSPVAGASVVIGGQGLQPGSAYSLVVRSNPITVTSGVASGTGSFSQRVTLPAGIAPGNHTITLRATGSDGSALVLTQSFTVAPNGTFSALGAVTGSTTGGLAVTGVNGPLGLGMMSLAALLVFVGAGLILARRRAEVVSS